MPAGSRLVNGKPLSYAKSLEAMPADGTSPSGNSWPSDISWNRLNVEPGTPGELIFSARPSPEWVSWCLRSR